jgi:hypothetical protein
MDKNDDSNPGLEASNLTAQIHHRGTGNPASVLPRSAISNCFPGLEFDFRNLWRRAFEGIVLVENNNYVIETDAANRDLLHCRLLRVNGFDTMVATTGPTLPDGDSGPLSTHVNPNAVSFMEWSNSIARLHAFQGKTVVCEFTAACSDLEVLASGGGERITRELLMRQFFEPNSAAFNPQMLQPGELTQGLCAPWQNDYRECACYYWAASRPDYVNVEAGSDGVSHGDMWFTKKRTGNYIPDNRSDTRLYSYDDLFMRWQEDLQFIIRGKDADAS